MIMLTPRWRRFGAATAACLPLLSAAACTSSAHKSSPSPTASPTTDAAAATAITRAIAATKVVRTYNFRAVQRLTGGATPQTTVLAGRAARPASITYTLTVGTSTQQVVRIGGRTFLRVPPAPWKALAKAGPAVDPLASLLPLLNGLQHATLTGNTLKGDVPASALSAAHLAPNGAGAGASAPVVLTLDGAGRVTSVNVHLNVQAGAKRLDVNETTTFSAFDHIRPIKAPGVIKAHK